MNDESNEAIRNQSLATSGKEQVH